MLTASARAWQAQGSAPRGAGASAHSEQALHAVARVERARVPAAVRVPIGEGQVANAVKCVLHLVRAQERRHVVLIGDADVAHVRWMALTECLHRQPRSTRAQGRLCQEPGAGAQK